MSTNEYMRKYMSERYRHRKALAIKMLGGKCAKCDSSKNLQFDHVVPRKKSSGFVIAKKLAGVAEDKLKAEIKKCQLLCEDHHSEKTILERGLNIAKGKHGTLSSYRYCKCEKCRKAKAEYQRNWEKKKAGRKC